MFKVNLPIFSYYNDKLIFSSLFGTCYHYRVLIKIKPQDLHLGNTRVPRDVHLPNKNNKEENCNKQTAVYCMYIALSVITKYKKK